MKVVGLVSGGKDSLYNLVQCQKHGHSIVCIANLYPADTGASQSGSSTGAPEIVHELDSYMFQTVGHTGVEAIAAAMDVPLVRRPFAGKAVQTGVDYRTDLVAGEDEIEDMLRLLQDVKVCHHGLTTTGCAYSQLTCGPSQKRFPEVTAVSSGAILSNYQRLRVENVCVGVAVFGSVVGADHTRHRCQRLGLTPLSFLWQRDQRSLLRAMVDDGIEARLIKVAGYGECQLICWCLAHCLRLTFNCVGLSIAQLGRTLGELQDELLEAVGIAHVGCCGGCSFRVAPRAKHAA